MKLSRMHQRVAMRSRQRGFIGVGKGGYVGGYTVKNSLRLRASASASVTTTMGAPTDQRKWTLSVWIKLGGPDFIFQANNGSNASWAVFGSAGITLTRGVVGTSITWNTTTVPAYRDFSGWYHAIWSFDSTQATAADRVKLYVGGNQVSVAGTQPALNEVTEINASGFLHTFMNGNVGGAKDGYLSEVNFIDGQALDPSYFGYFDPVVQNWWRPKKYTGTYGTNGRYYPFNDGTSLTTLGHDRSGNNNHATLNNVSLTAGATYDWMLDSPTNGASATQPVGNYATWNPLAANGSGPFSQANLTYGSNDATWRTCSSSIVMERGKWEAQATQEQASSTWYIGFGIASPTANYNAGNSAGAIGMALTMNSNSIVPYAFNVAGTTVAGAFNTTTVLRCAVDIDAGKVWLGYDTTWVGGGDPALGTSPTYTFTPGSPQVFVGSGYTNAASANFGQRPFPYTPSAGFKALCTANLPTPTGAAANPRLHHEVVTVTKSGDTNFTIPWDATAYDTLFEIKRRNGTGAWYRLDGVRGYNKYLNISTAAETTDANVLGVSGTTGTLKSTLADGTYVIRMWKAGLASARQTNTSGSITSTVSANPAAGFSIVTWTGVGGGSGQTIGHGVGAALAQIEVKGLDAGATGTDSWPVYNKNIGGGQYLLLDSSGAPASSAGYWNSSNPTSTVFSVGGNSNNVSNESGKRYVAYCWAEVRGYSLFTSYYGNGSADGPFPYSGFWLRSATLKRISAGDNWINYDTVRDDYNPLDSRLYPEFTAQEDYLNTLDAVCNGIKLRTASGTAYNLSGAQYLCSAFSALPLQLANAR